MLICLIYSSEKTEPFFVKYLRPSYLLLFTGCSFNPLKSFQCHLIWLNNLQWKQPSKNVARHQMKLCTVTIFFNLRFMGVGMHCFISSWEINVRHFLQCYTCSNCFVLLSSWYCLWRLVMFLLRKFVLMDRPPGDSKYNADILELKCYGYVLHAIQVEY